MKNETIITKAIVVVIMAIILVVSNTILNKKEVKEFVINEKELLKSNEGLIAIKANSLNQNTEEKVAITATKNIKELVIVYDNMTIEELIDKLNRVLSSKLSGKGELFAKHSLEMGVDPYIALAIIFQETGCYHGYCSYLVNSCNNIGGMKGGSSLCPGTSYAYFNNIDEGIVRFIDNLAYGYFYQGLVTPELMNRKYAEDKLWAYRVNNYVDIIRNS